MYADYVKDNHSQKYKTFQLFDLSKRVRHYLIDLDLITKFADFFGDRCDFQLDGFSGMTLSVLQNFHCLGKVICALSSTYETPLLAELFIAAGRHFARSLVAGRAVTCSMCSGRTQWTQTAACVRAGVTVTEKCIPYHECMHAC